MIALDADVLTEVLAGNQRLSERAAEYPVYEQGVPVIFIEEILRGRLNSIRQAEAAKSKLSIERAYELFQDTLNAVREIIVLPYSAEAEALHQSWRQQKIRVGTHDLRIAAICVVGSIKLITRNRRDFDQIPGLLLEVWE